MISFSKKNGAITALLFLILTAFPGCEALDGDESECGAPTLDGKLQSLGADCLNSDPEHLRLDKVNIPSGEKLDLYAFASGSDKEDGMRFTLDAGSIKIKHPDPEAAEVSVPGQNLTDGATWCIDMHSDENPIHVLIWKGENCDETGSSLEDKAVFNSEESISSWDGETNPSGSRFNYKASSDEVKVEKIEGLKPIFAE